MPTKSKHDKAIKDMNGIIQCANEILQTFNLEPIEVISVVKKISSMTEFNLKSGQTEFQMIYFHDNNYTDDTLLLFLFSAFWRAKFPCAGWAACIGGYGISVNSNGEFYRLEFLKIKNQWRLTIAKLNRGNIEIRMAFFYNNIAEALKDATAFIICFAG